jgi:predicted metallopeptidase
MSLQLAPDYQDIAEKLIDRFSVAFEHIELDKVLFLSETEKAPKKHAEVKIVRAPYTFMTEYKFIITFYDPMNAALTDAQKVMLVFHELLHIDNDFNKLRKHNVEDFRELVSKYGVNWDIDPNLENILDPK